MGSEIPQGRPCCPGRHEPCNVGCDSSSRDEQSPCRSEHHRGLLGRRASRNRHAAYFPRTSKPCTCNGVHRCDVGSHGNLCTRMEGWRSTTANHPFRGCRLSAVRRRDLRCHGTYGRQCARRSHVHEWQPRHAQLGRGVPHLAIYRGRDHCRRCAVPQTRHHHSG